MNILYDGLKIFSVSSLEKAASLLPSSAKRVGIVGGRWAGALIRAILPACPKASIVDNKTSDIAMVFGIGGKHTAAAAFEVAKRGGVPLYVIMMTPELPSPSLRAEKIIAVTSAFREVSREVLCSAFGDLASSGFLLADRRISDMMYDDFSPPVPLKKASEVLDATFCALERNPAPIARNIAISEGNLKLYALFAGMGCEKTLSEYLKRLDKERDSKDDGERAFVLSMIATRYCLAKFAVPADDFVPPPYINLRLKRLAELCNVPETTLARRITQKDVFYDKLCPRFREFSSDFIDILRETDERNLRALKILKRLRFDCGDALPSLLSPEFAAEAISLLPDLMTRPSTLLALRDRGDLDLLLNSASYHG